MKRSALSILVSLFLGCGEKQAPDGPNAPVSQPAASAPAPAGGGITCDAEIALLCDAGMRDGCSVKTADGAPLTSYHICVPEAEAGLSPCETEVIHNCAEGFIDGCMLNPPATKLHACVKAPAR